MLSTAAGSYGQFEFTLGGTNSRRDHQSNLIDGFGLRLYGSRPLNVKGYFFPRPGLPARLPPATSILMVHHGNTFKIAMPNRAGRQNPGFRPRDGCRSVKLNQRICLQIGVICDTALIRCQIDQRMTVFNSDIGGSIWKRSKTILS